MSGYPLYAPVHKGLRLALGNLSNHISKMNVENQRSSRCICEGVRMWWDSSFPRRE